MKTKKPLKKYQGDKSGSSVNNSKIPGQGFMEKLAERYGAGPFGPALGTLAEKTVKYFKDKKGKTTRKNVDTPVKNYNPPVKERVPSNPKAKKGGSTKSKKK